MVRGLLPSGSASTLNEGKMAILALISVFIVSTVLLLSNVRLSKGGNSLGFYISFIGLLPVICLEWFDVETGIKYLYSVVSASFVLPQLIRLIIRKGGRL